MKNISLKGTYALVTGASSGLGYAMAEGLAEAGAAVALASRTGSTLMDAVQKLRQQGCSVVGLPLDVRQEQSVDEAVQWVRKEWGRLDVLVNNAGIAHYGMLQDVSDTEWDDVMSVNLKGMFLCTQAFMSAMISQRYGRIINVSSIWGLSGASCEVLYSTAKGGMNAFTKALAKELGPSGVTVNAVAPGAVDTAMNHRLEPHEKDALEREIPAGRFAQPEEVASLVYFLALPESGYITGQIISPNGGWLT